MQRKPFNFAATTAFVGLLCTSQSVSAQDMVETIYLGGPILTINDDAPRAEAVAVADGKIVSVGSLSDIMALRGETTEIFDLEGRAMLPGFVDSHGHAVMGGLQALSANLLAAPDGDVTDIPSLQDTLRDWMAENAATVDKVQLIVGFGYDQSQLTELRHPTRDDLDEVSTDIPIIIVHQSGHFGVANSKALELTNVDASLPDPAGGIIRRQEDGTPSGVLEENAFFAVLTNLLGGLGEEGLRAFANAGPKLWAKFGYTTAQEGRAAPAIVEVMKSVASEGGFKVDVVVYPDMMVDRDYIAANVSDEYVNRMRVGGAKLTIDGSPQGFTAWRDRPYFDPVGEYEPGYLGYPAVTNEQVIDAVDWAFENDIQILVHSNGEAASDLLLASIDSATTKYGPADRRPVLIHGQFLREDQVDEMQRLDVFPSLFPMHTFYWGDWHRDHTVGPVLAENISPTGWVRQRGMKFGSHHDAPVAFPDSMRILDATVTRRTRSGDILGPSQRVDVMTALKSMTIWPAWQHYESDMKGSIEVGKLADFVILSDDPTAVDPEILDTLTVMTTIKEDEVIYSAQAPQKDGALQGSQSRVALASSGTPMDGHAFLHVTEIGMLKMIGAEPKQAKNSP
ncbi:amidohydrolase [Sulfitobacter sp. SK012]|uniref:amidohydrolase n=1 Tax=Sulfitobacter sp. SK012 TaxID=1389005 RepID=UPI000E0A8D74|nr:amidohydrolase [Sulfitobacter sp. SK012]AXI47123.1 amidohydrolase [Sulfitobacter sp. SK012]